MRRGVVAFSALALFGLGLAGCGISRYQQREPWRGQAEAACVSQKRVAPSAYMSRLSPVEGPGVCGMSYPYAVAAFANGSVGLTRTATLACPMIPTIEAWLTEVVQPAAALAFGARVAEVRSGSYSCRSRNNQRGATLSEHAFGNAFDVMAFRLADGREVSVVRGWRGAPEEQEFLREVFVGACRYFHTVLGPGADVFHHDHFHLDLARHDPRGLRHVCKPVLKFTPRIEPGASAAPGPRLPAPEQHPRDIETDDDPFAVSAARPPARPSRLAGQAYAGLAPTTRPGAGADDGTQPRRPRDASAPGVVPKSEARLSEPRETGAAAPARLSRETLPSAPSRSASAGPGPLAPQPRPIGRHVTQPWSADGIY